MNPVTRAAPVLLLALALAASVACAANAAAPAANATGNPRIIGGQVASKKVRRRLVHLQIATKDGGFGTCTATMYSRRWLLSAAHCLDKPGSREDIDVRESFAFISPKSASSDIPAPRFYFAAVHIPNAYHYDNNELDIALIRLERRIPLRKFRQVLVGAEPDPGTPVIAAGYGDVSGDGDPATYAMETTLIAQDFDTCAWHVDDDDALIQESEVCVVSRGFPDQGLTGNCFGDSGGPIFTTNSNGQLEQIGVAAFFYGDKCDSPGTTFWYTRLTYYKAELDDIVANGSTESFQVLE